MSNDLRNDRAQEGHRLEHNSFHWLKKKWKRRKLSGQANCSVCCCTKHDEGWGNHHLCIAMMKATIVIISLHCHDEGHSSHHFSVFPYSFPVPEILPHGIATTSMPALFLQSLVAKTDAAVQIWSWNLITTGHSQKGTVPTVWMRLY